MKFEVQKVSTDAQTGFTKIVIVYDFGSKRGQQVDERGFSSAKLAEIYIDSMRRDYLKKMVELYVHHAKHIFETSRLNYYAEPARVETLQRCMNAVKVIAKETSLKVICGYINSSQNLFKAILPLSTNVSFDSSEERLTVMLTIAKQYLIIDKKKHGIAV